jgi:phosphoenolpyruvate carboxykinase (ATP)
MDSYLRDLGINPDSPEKSLYINRPNCFYIDETIRKGKGKLSSQGALVVETGKFTGRAAKDKYVVKSSTTEKSIWWENNVLEMTPDTFKRLKAHVSKYLNNQRDLYITEHGVGAHSKHNLVVRLITPSPHHALFSNHMFRQHEREFSLTRDFLILHAPELTLDPKDFNTRSETAIVTDFDSRTVIIVGTKYAGEIKKSIFSIMNYILPQSGVLPMHAGANCGSEGSSAFFGLSGTGKTTLSTDEGRHLIGDDEHGLSDEGIFNFEGGCYAKTHKLSEKTEPGIYHASMRFGALLENVVMNPKTRELDFYDASITENGRSSYPLSFIDGVVPSHNGEVPKNIFFLSADAFGVLPPVAKLTPAQAMFYFVLGYTAKVAGTEAGVVEPSATYSPCFGAPFMMRHPSEYARLLEQYLNKHKIQVWLINTGWTGGPYGVGRRYDIPVTREIIRAVQAGKLGKTPVEKDPIFGFQIPTHVEGLDSKTLMPWKGWPNQKDYEAKAKELAHAFHGQMKKFGDFYTQNRAGAPLWE